MCACVAQLCVCVRSNVDYLFNVETVKRKKQKMKKKNIYICHIITHSVGRVSCRCLDRGTESSQLGEHVYWEKRK